MNTTARKVRSSVTVSGLALLLATAAATLAPAASAASAAPADASQPPALAVSTAAPAEIGLAGQPVAFTTKVSNTGRFDSTATRLIFRVDGAGGLEPNALSLEYRLSGTAWQKVPLTLTGTQFAGEMPQTFPLAAGKSRTVQLRIGLPMGTPHNGDSNGGAERLKLTTMVSYGASGAANDSDEDTIKVDALAGALSHVPATVTAGGPGVTFQATLRNPTASAYVNVTDTLVTNRYASVQVLRSGKWTTLAPRTTAAEPDVYGFDVVGKDAALSAHGSTSVTVRLSYRKDAPTGKTTVNPCVFVNQGTMAFSGTTFCTAGATLTVKAAGAATPTPSSGSSKPATPSPSASASASAAPSASVTSSPSVTTGTTGTAGTTGGTGQLAHTGSNGMPVVATAAGALVVAGGGGLGFVALRRRRRAQG
ncbi:hypothetical protein [Actinacidiphila acidipaludis]|uniref:Gram-positive cocci surface proteins LPxTG domain-containing protein n=1 Tax=Actinacidiphila acidipaludis TaxID=2873382 RepID=A0ABS7QEG7_9ACTN|nr:hypothetical protein [Streptomyces acidipaludis]MBY8881563.1 hypothetical protein [Streptomyces acidipaludis]